MCSQKMRALIYIEAEKIMFPPKPDIHTYRQTYIQTDIHTYIHTDRQTDRHSMLIRTCSGPSPSCQLLKDNCTSSK